MGMMKCEYCDCPISTMAHKCPNCGGVVTVHEEKKSIPHIEEEKKQDESIIKSFFAGIGLICRKIIKYTLITLVTLTIIFFIIGIVVIVKGVNGDFDSNNNTTTIESNT